MVTGYTSQLEQEGMTTAKWIKQHLARAFGICVMFRDEGQLTETEILKKLKKEMEDDLKPDSHHKEGLREAQEKLKELESLTGQELHHLVLKKNEQIRERNKSNLKKANYYKELHERTVADLMMVKENTEDETTRSIVEFGIEQIERCHQDRKPFLTDEITSEVDYQRKEIKSAKWSVDYHSKGEVESLERETDRYEAYTTLIKEVNRILDDE